MSVTTVTHLNFHGQAREALTFYQSVFGGQAVIATYGDFGLPPELTGADKVVFGQITADSGFQVMAYDVPSQYRTTGNTPVGNTPVGTASAGNASAGNTSAETASAGKSSAATTRRENGMTLTSEPFFVSVRGDTVEEVKALWDRLSVAATIIEPYGPAQWAPAFGMLTDRFGVTWILDVTAAY